MYTENEYYGNMPKSNIVSHSAKGSTWSKSGAKYTKRYWKNGKWYYEYAITNAMKKSSDFDKRRAEKFNEMDSKKRAANLGEIDKYARKSWNDTLKEREDLARTNNRVSGNYYKKQQSINLQKKKKNAEDRREAHEQYLKDTQEGRNRERQAKILKGKTGGVVNAKHDKRDNSWGKERETDARVNHRKINRNVSDMKNNAKNKRPNVSVNSNDIPLRYTVDYSKWPKGSIPRDMGEYYMNTRWEGILENRRKERAADREAKTKKLKSKSYQLKNKAEGKVRTLKKKISR